MEAAASLAAHRESLTDARRAAEDACTWICTLIWFVLLGVLLAGYAILDGFDLGVGILHPLARTTASGASS